ncbi:MAG: hypothetical protein QM534_19255 [Sediminibacterium sp.]|nr:hypothetical protein [Sediminibacterium sp.]
MKSKQKTKVTSAATLAMINSAGFGAHKSVADRGTIVVSNSSGTLTVAGTNLIMDDFVHPTQTLVVFANLNY